MSDSWLLFIPADIEAAPSKEAADNASALLKTFTPEALGEVRARFAPTIEFHSGGANWSGVKCPNCDADIEAWWTDAMDAAWSREFKDLAVTTPCCDHSTALNDLNYVWPAGFSRFVLEAMNPNTHETTPEQDRALAEALGFEVRKIWTHI